MDTQCKVYIMFSKIEFYLRFLIKFKSWYLVKCHFNRKKLRIELVTLINVRCPFYLNNLIIPNGKT